MYTFDEDALNIACEHALGYCAPFSEDDCQLVNSLVIMHAQDISELTVFPNLRYLEIFASDALDLAPFSALKELEVLKILCTPLPETEAIGELTSLKEIELNFTSAEDITPILALPNLTKAVFMANPLCDASYNMIEALKAEQVSSANWKGPMIWVSDRHISNAIRKLFDLGYCLCCETTNEMSLIVKPGRPIFTSLECDYLTGIGGMVLLNLLAKEERSLATIFEKPTDPESSELRRLDFSRIDQLHFATASEASDWVSTSNLSMKEKDHLQKFISNFSSLTFYRESPELVEQINQVERIELPAHIVEAITTLAFVLPNQRPSFKLTTTPPDEYVLLEHRPFVFFYCSSEIEKIADIDGNEIEPFEIAEDIISGELRLVINLADPLDSNIYLYDLHDESTSSVVYPVFTSYPDLLYHIVMIKAAGTTIESFGNLDSEEFEFDE